MEWNGMELSNFDWMFKNKEIERNENEWNLNNLIWEQHGGN